MELLTPFGIAGVAVVRATDAEATQVRALLRTPAGEFMHLHPGDPPRRGTLWLRGHPTDDVLVVDRGEHGLELHVHGSRAVLDCLHRELGLVSPTPTPAWRLVRSALSLQQLQLGIEQVEADFDTWLQHVDRLPNDRRERAARDASDRSAAAMALATPRRVALVGCQNAGKSSLFNLALARERVVTGPTPGLTRDPVAEQTTLAGYPYELIDTAGEGPTDNDVDAAALRLAVEAGTTALRVLVIDAAVGPTADDRRLLPLCPIVVATKADLPPAPWPPDVSCHLRVAGRDDQTLVRRELGEVLRCHRALPPAGPVGGVAALDRAQWELLQQRTRPVVPGCHDSFDPSTRSTR